MQGQDPFTQSSSVHRSPGDSLFSNNQCWCPMLMCRNFLEICGNGVVCLQNPAIMWKTVCCNHGNFHVFTAVDELHVSVWQELWSEDSLADPWNKLWSRNSNFKVKLCFLIGTLRAGQAAVRKVRQSHISLLLLDCCKGQNRDCNSHGANLFHRFSLRRSRRQRQLKVEQE